jgi:ribonuclease HII
MTLVIGTDEAGYGPNLGPLVVAATAWLVDDSSGGFAADRLARANAAVAGAIGGAPPWGDSKRLYQSGHGLAGLEAGVLAALAAGDARAVSGAATAPGPHPPADGRELADRLGISAAAEAPEWPRVLAARVPVAVAGDRLGRLTAAVAAALPAAGVRRITLRCRVIQPAEFNALLAAGNNKSDILSRATLELAAGLRAAAPAEAAEVECDRHGGRKAYAGLVAAHFGAGLVRALEESARVSRYEVPGARLRIAFSVGGEEQVAVALASMTAKYVRELAMTAFNAHWSGLQPGLAPSAGYPVDARRWWHAAAAAVRAAGLDADAIWRRS